MNDIDGAAIARGEGEYTTPTEHLGEYLLPLGPHVCPRPEWTRTRTEPWECGQCGRLFGSSDYGWVELRGPR